MKNKKKSNPIITMRDRLMLEVVDKVNVARAMDVMVLVGMSHITNTRKRLKVLEEKGWLKIEKYELENVYMLTYAGLSELEKINAKPLEWNQGTRHALQVTRVLAYLVLQGIDITDLQSDKELKALHNLKNEKNIPHLPDITAPHDVCYEVELTMKAPERLERNILANNKNYNKQIWVVPDIRPTLKRKIEEIAKKHLIEDTVSVLSLDEINKEMKARTTSANKKQDAPIKKFDDLFLAVDDEEWKGDDNWEQEDDIYLDE